MVLVVVQLASQLHSWLVVVQQGGYRAGAAGGGRSACSASSTPAGFGQPLVWTAAGAAAAPAHQPAPTLLLLRRVFMVFFNAALTYLNYRCVGCRDAVLCCAARQASSAGFCLRLSNRHRNCPSAFEPPPTRPVCCRGLHVVGDAAIAMTVFTLLPFAALVLIGEAAQRNRVLGCLCW